MKIGTLSKKTGLSVDTIRYYERIGLMPEPDRNASGQRDYDTTTLAWVAFLLRLKATGMPISEMQTYAELRSAGERTTGQREALLSAHRDRVLARIAQLTADLEALDAKIETYRNMAKSNDEPDTDRNPS